MAASKRTIITSSLEQEDEYRKLQRRIENVEHLLTRNHVTNAPNRQELLGPYLQKKVSF